MNVDLTMYHLLVVGLVSVSFFIIGLILVDVAGYFTRRRKRKREEDKDK